MLPPVSVPGRFCFDRGLASISLGLTWKCETEWALDLRKKMPHSQAVNILFGAWF